MSFYLCGHDRGKVFLRKSIAEYQMYEQWKASKGFKGDKSLCWMCWNKERRLKGE